MQSQYFPKFVVLSVALSVFVAASCSTDGVTPTCPPLPLYQTYALGDASPPDAATADSPEVKMALAAAIASGCITAPEAPTTTPPQGGAPSSAGSGGKSGSGGSGGSTAGSGGKGGSGGKPSTSVGGTSANNAGAAGAN